MTKKRILGCLRVPPVTVYKTIFLFSSLCFPTTLSTPLGHLQVVKCYSELYGSLF
jgi:hypothetical protein